MTSFPLYFLLLFILFPPVLSLFCLFLFSRFFHLFLPFKLHFVGLFIISVFLHVKLCAKKYLSFWTSAKLSFFCLLFSIKISVFSVSFFCWAFLRLIYFSMFCFSVSWKNGFSLCLTLLFSILLVNSVSFFYCPFFLMYPRIKKVVFWWKWWKNCLWYSVSVLFVLFFFLKRQCGTRKNPLYFPLFLKLFESFSLFTSKHRETDKKKDFIFCFCPVPLLFHFLKTFSHFLHFHRCCLCSLFPFIFFVHLFLLFSPFSFLSFLLPFFFSLSQCFSSSFFFNLMFPCIFSIAVLCIFFWINSFFFSLFCSWSQSSFLHFFFVSVSFLSCQTKYKNFSFFFEEDCFLNPPFFLCLISCFSSLRRPYSLSVPCFLDFWAVLEITFLDFLFIYLRFGSLQKIVVVFGHNFQKISLILVRKITLGKKPLFSWFWHFLLLIFFMHDLHFSFFLSFSCKYLVSFCFLNLFVSVQKKKPRKTNWSTLFLCLLSLFLLFLSCSLSRRFYSLFSPCLFSFFCLFMFPLLMFNYSPYVYLFSLMFLLFVFIPFFLHCSSLFFKTFFSNSFVSSFFFWFFNLVLSNKDLSLFYEKSLKTLNFWEKLFSFIFAKNCHRNCWRNKQFCPDLICRKPPRVLNKYQDVKPSQTSFLKIISFLCFFQKIFSQ